MINYTEFLIILPLLILIFMISKYTIEIGANYIYGDIEAEKKAYNISLLSDRSASDMVNGNIYKTYLDRDNGGCSSWSWENDKNPMCRQFGERQQRKNKAIALSFYFIGLVQIIAGMAIKGTPSITMLMSGTFSIMYAIMQDWDNLTNVHKLGLSLFGLFSIVGVAYKKDFIK